MSADYPQHAITLEELAAANGVALKADWVPAPEIKPGGCFYLAALRADERDQLEEWWRKYRRDDDSEIGFRAFVVAYCACTPDNGRFYTSFEAINAAAEHLGHLGARFVSRAFMKAAMMNGLLADELEKNSLTTQNAAGNGGSP